MASMELALFPSLREESESSFSSLSLRAGNEAISMHVDGFVMLQEKVSAT